MYDDYQTPCVAIPYNQKYTWQLNLMKAYYYYGKLTGDIHKSSIRHICTSTMCCKMNKLPQLVQVIVTVLSYIVMPLTVVTLQHSL